MQKYDIMGLIGEGAYGVVLKCRCNQNKEVVAIKKFKESEEDEVVKKTTMRQVKILKLVRHPNVVDLKEAFRKKGIVYLVFQYVQNNLLEVLEGSPEGLEPETIRLLMYQLLKGLAYMHSMNIIHRDIKPENLLISDKKELKICDFGFARQLRRPHDDELTDYVATRWYRPPELLVGAPYSRQIDIWAVGCILGELIDGNPMFPGENELDQLFLIQKCLGPLTADHYETFLKNPRFLGMKFPDIQNLETIDKRYLGKLSPKALHFLKQLLKMNPADRLSALDALKHPYFDGLREDDFLRKLSSNNYIRSDPKIVGNPSSRQQQPRTVNHDRKKHQTNAFQGSNERERTEQATTAGEFNRSKMNMGRKPKEDFSKLLSTKGFSNIHSKSVNKNKAPQKKDKNISLEKHQNRETIAKTQTGFYILTGGGVIHQRQEEQSSPQAGQHRNKIYNASNSKSPKSRNHHRTKNLLTNTEEIAEEEEVWTSSSQLPLIMIGSQQQRSDKPKGHLQPPANIIITNSTFNYKSSH